MTITFLFSPYGESSAKQILCEALGDLTRSTWEHVELKKSEYWKHPKHSGKIVMKEENRFVLDAEDTEAEGYLFGAFMAWVARYAHQNLWSVTVVFGDVSD